MNKKTKAFSTILRLSACAVVITALVDLIAKEEQKTASGDSVRPTDETGGKGR